MNVAFEPRRILRITARVTVGVALAAALATVTSRVARVYPVSSDDATGILEAKAVLQGNVLLRGWTLSNASFATTDLPFYIVAVALRGMRPSLLRDVPVMVYVAMVAAALALGRGRRRASGGRAWLGVVAVVVLLGLPAGGLAEFVTKGYIRVGTTLGLFLALLALDVGGDQRIPARRLGLFAGLLALVMFSDGYALVFGGLPLLMVGAFGLCRANRYGPGRPVAVCSFALAAVVASLGLSHVVRAAGGFQVVPIPVRDYWPGYDPIGVVAGNTRVLAANLPSLYRCVPGEWRSPGDLAASLGCWIGPGLLLLAVAGLPAWRRLRGDRDHAGDQARPADFVGDVLCVAIVLGLLAFIGSGNPKDRATLRYMIPVILSGAVLTGRRLADSVIDPRPYAVALAVLAASYAVTVTADFRKPPAEHPSAALADWLIGRGLVHGFGPYWDANILTIYGADRVTMRPVTAERGIIEPFRWMSDDQWFSEGPVQFVAFSTHPGVFYDFQVNERICNLNFGLPVHRYEVGTYTVLTYNGDLRAVLSRRRAGTTRRAGASMHQRSRTPVRGGDPLGRINAPCARALPGLDATPWRRRRLS
jgi:hypothetical protein